MADQTMVTENRWTTPFICTFYVLCIAAATLMVACQDPTTAIEVRERGRDTIPTFHVDTVIEFHVDTVWIEGDRIYCWLVDENRYDEPWFGCDDGYLGPRR